MKKLGIPSGQVSMAPVWVVVGWTLFMWTTRLRLIFTEVDLSLGDVVVRIVPVVVFVCLAIILAVSGLTGRPKLRPTVVMVSAWTTVYWLIRVVVITAHPHSVGFKLVHAALAVISIGTALWALARTSR